MEVLKTIFGEGDKLNALNMSCRGIAIFLIALVMIRVSGRRSFGIRTPMDNIIVVLLGAVLSRAITGASAMLPTICAAFAIVVAHRLFAKLMIRSTRLSELSEGDKILLYKDGKFIQKNLARGLMREEDVVQGIREAANTDDLNKIKLVYLERNGEISVITKDGES
jgi:uncharacterized membrane protein YcaP (DUF421 family)